MYVWILVALPLVHAARHNDVKPLLGRELMILTHDDDDVCMYVCFPIGSSRAGDHELTWLGRDSMSFADVGEDAEAGGVQLHRRRRQLQGGSGPSDRSARHRTIKCRVPKMSTWWDHLNIILPHVCAIQVCIYVDGGSYDDPKIDWLEADHFKWSVIIDLVWNRCCSVGYLWHCHLFMLLDTTT